MRTLRDLREHLRVSQRVVAERAGRTQQWVSKIELSDKLSFAQATEYVTALGCSLSLEITLDGLPVLSFQAEPEAPPPLPSPHFDRGPAGRARDDSDDPRLS